MEKTTIKGGSTFLHWASEQDETAIFLEQALELAPSLLYVRNKRGLSPLHVACACGAIEVVQIILKADSREASTIDEQGWSPFLYALLREEIDRAMLVLRAGPTTPRLCISCAYSVVWCSPSRRRRRRNTRRFPLLRAAPMSVCAR